MFEASNFNQVTPGNSGNSTKESKAPIAHINAIITICLVDQTLVFLLGIF